MSDHEALSHTPVPQSTHPDVSNSDNPNLILLDLMGRPYLLCERKLIELLQAVRSLFSTVWERQKVEASRVDLSEAKLVSKDTAYPDTRCVRSRPAPRCPRRTGSTRTDNLKLGAILTLSSLTHGNSHIG